MLQTLNSSSTVWRLRLNWPSARVQISQRFGLNSTPAWHRNSPHLRSELLFFWESGELKGLRAYGFVTFPVSCLGCRVHGLKYHTTTRCCSAQGAARSKVTNLPGNTTTIPNATIVASSFNPCATMQSACTLYSKQLGKSEPFSSDMLHAAIPMTWQANMLNSSSCQKHKHKLSPDPGSSIPNP